jgi:hypothetical protein
VNQFRAPLTPAELEAKFRGNAALTLPDAQIERVVRSVNGLATGTPLREVVVALTS